MNCDSFEKLIALHVERDLESSQIIEVENHLKSCAYCQRLQVELEASQAAVKELAAETVDPNSFNVVRQRVMAELHRRQTAHPLWWRLFPAFSVWRPAWAVALTILVVIGVLLQWQLSRKPAVPDKSVVVAPTLQSKPPNFPTATPSQGNTVNTDARSLDPRAKQAIKRRAVNLPQELLLARVEPEVVTEATDEPVEQGANLEPDLQQPTDVTPEPPPPLVIKLVTDDPNIVIVWLVDQEIHHN